MTPDEKLDRILSILESAPVPAPDVPAYELPDLLPSQITEAMADGSTVLSDGSVWATQHGGAFIANNPETGRGGGVGAGPVVQGPDSTQLVQVHFGYLSRKKLGADVWDRMAAIMGPERWAAFEADLAARPFQLFRADPRAVVFSGDPNALNLSYVLQSFGEFVQ